MARSSWRLFKTGSDKRNTARRGTRGAAAWLLAAAAASVPVLSAAAAGGDAEQFRAWIAEMKEQPRGPFVAIRWYCKDGKVLGAKESCREYGGGVQHGEWSPRTRQIRAAGYPIANLLVTIEPQKVVGPTADPSLLPAVLLERFLVAFDQGWIFRGAQYYRGAIQDDNERESARAILMALLKAPESSFTLTREAARLLPHGADTALTTQVRGMAASLGEKDPGFVPLRSRIHNSPESADAARVRAYAGSPKARPALKDDYQKLALAIERAYNPQPLSKALVELVPKIRHAEATARLKGLAQRAGGSDQATEHLRIAAETLAAVREILPEIDDPAARLALLDLSVNAESAVMAATPTLLQQMPSTARSERIQWLALTGHALYGIGLLTQREWSELQDAVASLPSGKIPLVEYREQLEYFERIPAWSARRLQYDFGAAIERLAKIEPLAEMFVPDRLRGSPLLFYSTVLQSLRTDADRLAQARNEVFGEVSQGQLRRLNPGIARGILRTSIASGAGDVAPAIYLVPETTAELPQAAGILTADEGNPLSHVQLLARNLGIPNIVVTRDLLSKLHAHSDRPVVIAASSGGVVHIAEDGPAWDRILGRERQVQAAQIVVETPKLDLTRLDLVSTAQLRSAHSGRIVGPKAAQVGELSRRFPDMVSPGLAVPFGVYAELLQRPVRRGGPAMIDWMRAEYESMALQRGVDPEGYRKRVSGFLAFVRGWITDQELGPELRDRLFHAMHDRFGMAGTYGVFVRSDTNVEDLPGFTGAGLNLTVPNVVRFDEVVTALKQVWASPFTERAYGWRQDLMDRPEQLYVSVLLHKTVPGNKSGVLITADLDTGRRDTLTVVAHPGVGGGVDSEAAETLKVSLDTGKARLLASSTATRMRILPPGGGARVVASPAPETVLAPGEIAQLAELARAIPEQFPELRDGEGQPAPADVEFAFVHGKLMLLQIRPFLQNRAAAAHAYLTQLDAALEKRGKRPVDLRRAPSERES